MRAKIFAAAVLVLALIAMTSLVANAASGPSVTKTVKKENQRPGEVTEEEAEKYKCSALATMNERVKCRLQLEEENEYGYLPEECRIVVNDSRGQCIANYKKSQNCWRFEKDSDRFLCAKAAFDWQGSVAEQKQKCDNLTGTNRSDCILLLRERVDLVVKFRIYNLEEKAQHLLEKNLTGLDEVASLVAALEQQKQNYNNAKTIDEKKAVVRGVQKLWKDFITGIKGKT